MVIPSQDDDPDGWSSSGRNSTKSSSESTQAKRQMVISLALGQRALLMNVIRLRKIG